MLEPEIMSQVHPLRLVPRHQATPTHIRPESLDAANLSQFQEASNALSMATYYLRSGQLLGAQHKARMALVALHRLQAVGPVGSAHSAAA
jgi:hypothetical protein